LKKKKNKNKKDEENSIKRAQTLWQRSCSTAGILFEILRKNAVFCIDVDK